MLLQRLPSRVAFELIVAVVSYLLIPGKMLHYTIKLSA